MLLLLRNISLSLFSPLISFTRYDIAVVKFKILKFFIVLENHYLKILYVFLSSDNLVNIFLKHYRRFSRDDLNVIAVEIACGIYKSHVQEINYSEKRWKGFSVTSTNLLSTQNVVTSKELEFVIYHLRERGGGVAKISQRSLGDENQSLLYNLKFNKFWKIYTRCNQGYFIH